MFEYQKTNMHTLKLFKDAACKNVWIGQVGQRYVRF